MEEKDLSCFGLVFTACSVFGRLLASIFYNALHRIVEYRTTLHCIVVYCTILHCIALYRTNIALHSTVLRNVADLWRRASA